MQCIRVANVQSSTMLCQFFCHLLLLLVGLYMLIGGTESVRFAIRSGVQHVLSTYSNSKRERWTIIQFLSNVNKSHFYFHCRLLSMHISIRFAGTCTAFLMQWKLSMEWQATWQNNKTLFLDNDDEIERRAFKKCTLNLYSSRATGSLRVDLFQVFIISFPNICKCFKWRTTLKVQRMNLEIPHQAPNACVYSNYTFRSIHKIFVSFTVFVFFSCHSWYFFGMFSACDKQQQNASSTTTQDQNRMKEYTKYNICAIFRNWNHSHSLFDEEQHKLHNILMSSLHMKKATHKNYSV